MLDRLTPFFTTVSRALREEPDTSTHWDAMLGRAPELAAEDSDDLALSDNVTLIVGAPVFFQGSLNESNPKP